MATGIRVATTGRQQGKWRSASLQGCPREVRLLLAGLYYYDVDMVNSLPNVARQLARLGMDPGVLALSIPTRFWIPCSNSRSGMLASKARASGQSYAA